MVIKFVIKLLGIILMFKLYLILDRIIAIYNQCNLLGKSLYITHHYTIKLKKLTQ